MFDIALWGLFSARPNKAIEFEKQPVVHDFKKTTVP